LELLHYIAAQPHPFFFLLIRRVRITSSGGEVGRLNTGGGTEVFFFFLIAIALLSYMELVA